MYAEDFVVDLIARTAFQKRVNISPPPPSPSAEQAAPHGFQAAMTRHCTTITHTSKSTLTMAAIGRQLKTMLKAFQSFKLYRRLHSS